MNGTKSNAPKISQSFIDMIDDHFLEAARYLRKMQDDHPDDFVSVAKKLKIGKRKAYHLAQIDRSFHKLGIATDRLRRIGWTKLALLAPYIDADNVVELLALAEDCTTHKLKMHLRGGEFDPNSKTVVLHLSVSQYMLFENALLAAGAIKHPRGLLHKEEALTKLLSSNLSD